jgi:hypothetical protein
VDRSIIPKFRVLGPPPPSTFQRRSYAVAFIAGFDGHAAIRQLAVFIAKGRYSFTDGLDRRVPQQSGQSSVARLVPKEASPRRATDTIGPAGSP